MEVPLRVPKGQLARPLDVSRHDGAAASGGSFDVGPFRPISEQMLPETGATNRLRKVAIRPAAVVPAILSSKRKMSVAAVS
jgi:hypothetical protein